MTTRGQKELSVAQLKEVVTLSHNLTIAAHNLTIAVVASTLPPPLSPYLGQPPLHARQLEALFQRMIVCLANTRKKRHPAGGRAYVGR